MIRKAGICILSIFVLSLTGLKALNYAHMPHKKPLCERDMHRSLKKAECLFKNMESFAEDDFANLLTICIYRYSEADSLTSESLKKLQSELLSFLEKAKADSSESVCEEEACFLLAKTCFYQNDYDNVRRYLNYLLGINHNSPNFVEINFWLLRIEIAEKKFKSAEKLLSQLSYLKDNSDTLNSSALEYALLESDYYLNIGKIENLVPTLEVLKSQILLSEDKKRRISFILAQLLSEKRKYEEAAHYYSEAMKGLESPNPLYAYAYVNRELCFEHMRQREADSIFLNRINESNESPFEPTIVESTHDSAFIYSIYPYYFKDMASRFFYSESYANELEDTCSEDTCYEYSLEEGDYWYDDNDTTGISTEMLKIMFENWDSVSVHIPKADFSHLEDTIYLPLVEQDYILPPYAEVTSEFGWRRYRYHYGIDIKNKTGDSIYAVFDGFVRIARRVGTYGNVVVIRHLNGLETFYAHCSKILVKPNQEVKSGELIALAGSTGRSTGPHLHLEVRYKGVPFNPRYIIDFDSNRLRNDTLMITRETFNYLKPYGSSGSGSVSALYYKVKYGDTLSRIAMKYHTSVSTIKRLNGLRSDFIREGRRLRVR